MVDCDENLARCIFSCPCHGNCEQGCDECDSSYCKCHTDGDSQDKKECLDKLDLLYVTCIINCDYDEVCVSNCVREHNQDVSKCPCNEGCPSGCPCPDYECGMTTEITTTTEKLTTIESTTKTTTIPTTTTPPDGDTILALTSGGPYAGPEGAALIRNDYYLGNLTVEIDNFQYPANTAVYYSCSLTWKNTMLVFGGMNIDNKPRVDNQERA